MSEAIATRFHVNPETGDVGRCRAKIKCDFDLTDDEHHKDRASAVAAAELLMQEKFSHLSNMQYDFLDSETSDPYFSIEDALGNTFDYRADLIDSDTTWIYSSGQCFSFALEAHKKTGWPIVAAITDSFSPIHVMLDAGDRGYFDIKGFADRGVTEESYSEMHDANFMKFDHPEYARLFFDGHMPDQNFRAAATFVEPALARAEAIENGSFDPEDVWHIRPKAVA